MLGVMGHHVFATHSGFEGITEAQKIRPDVIFCDIGLPGLNGYEVAKTLKADTELKGVFLIALTGYAGDFDIERARTVGFDRHLAKTVDKIPMHQFQVQCAVFHTVRQLLPRMA